MNKLQVLKDSVSDDMLNEFIIAVLDDDIGINEIAFGCLEAIATNELLNCIDVGDDTGVNRYFCNLIRGKRELERR